MTRSMAALQRPAVESAMGAKPEDMSVEEILERPGFLESFPEPPRYRRGKEPVGQHARSGASIAFGGILTRDSSVRRRTESNDRNWSSPPSLRERRRTTAVDLARVICRDVDMDKHVRRRGYDEDVVL